ncbi:DUF4127 family protein [Dactylosporangium fulvum]|uniref:DUF4127 family protein n=1 Tax=Dactylosporangium fulvum TaxID=53359 RepID=A0ABY5W4Z5_9ACTN|nr:DUF4127 family protein [Dactylosporangium fulvum]UWP84396.1 DUF4127 family protein [Dactylosporangium fulvum]
MLNGSSRRSLLRAAAAAATIAAVPTLAESAAAATRDGSGRPGRSPSPLGVIAVVPLDDRPYTWYAPQQIATGAGYRTQLPPRSLLGRHAVPGDGAAVGDWLLRHADTADAFVVALPMIAYGGLLNSRNSSVPEREARDRLARLDRLRRRYPRRRLYAFDTIMRLTPEGPWRLKLRDWATVKDEVENLGMTEKRPQLTALEAEIPADVRADYLATRARNHRINLAMIDWAARGVFDFLVIGQDDATGHGLHRPESLALAERIRRLGVGDRVVIYPGADVVASLLIAKIAVADARVSPRVHVEYSRAHGDEWTAPFQNIPYSALIDGYVRTLGGTVVDGARTADVILMANTGGSAAPVDAFADRLVAYVRAGRTVAVGDDAIAGVADRRLLEPLDGRVRYGEFAAYSGWNVGISIAQSLSRWALHERSRRLPAPRYEDLLREAAQASIELTLSEWVQTHSYRNFVRTAATAYATSLGEADPQNIQRHYDAVNAYAVEHTLPYARELFDTQFAGASVRLGHSRGGPWHAQVARVDRVQDWNLYLPWNRTGEIAAEPRVVLGTARRRQDDEG